MTRLIAVCLALAPVALAQDGRALFERNCSNCHNPTAEGRTPTLDAVKRLTNAAILTAMQTGVMKFQAADLSQADRRAIADFLVAPAKAVGPGVGLDVARRGSCPADGAVLANLEGWNGWGGDLANSRYQGAKAAGMRGADLPKLELKWAFGVPNTESMFGQPTAVGGRLFFGSNDGTVYSLDMATGCQYWKFQAAAQVRTPMEIVQQDGRFVAFFGDGGATVYAVDARTGELVWKTHIDEHKLAGITGAPKYYQGRVIVGVRSGVEEMVAAQKSYPCCTFRGSVAALDAKTGKVMWKTYTIPDAPSKVGQNSAGTDRFGPSGVGVWSSPTIDGKRKAVYVGTGNDYSEPKTRYADAILAFDLETGSLRWSKQMNEDAWNYSCSQAVKTNCPANPDGDTDIGTSPILRRLANGKDVLVFGQKSGHVRAIDPDRRGELVWENRPGKGGALGGVLWGLAMDETKVYAPISDVTVGAAGGLFAYEITTGKQVWSAAPAEAGCKGKAGCSAAQMAPATAIEGAVFSGSLDGHLRAYDSRDGKVIWDYDTLREYTTVNGVAAHGGSLNATGPVVSRGMLFVNSGYSQLTGMGGNVLLAFGLR